ncbi:hypothetical protein PAMP_023732 [Pampus punctatissimus]
MHQRTKEDREATFTLTNIVPQQEGSNSGPWNSLENDMLKKFMPLCKGPMYVITGALPYENKAHWLNNRVSVPEYMWSAYCCPRYSNTLPKSEQAFFPTYAAVGRNDRNSGKDIEKINPNLKVTEKEYDVMRMPLEDLEGILAQRLHMSISLFDRQCQ